MGNAVQCSITVLRTLAIISFRHALAFNTTTNPSYLDAPKPQGKFQGRRFVFDSGLGVYTPSVISPVSLSFSWGISLGNSGRPLQWPNSAGQAGGLSIPRASWSWLPAASPGTVFLTLFVQVGWEEEEEASSQAQCCRCDGETGVFVLVVALVFGGLRRTTCREYDWSYCECPLFGLDSIWLRVEDSLTKWELLPYKRLQRLQATTSDT